MNLIRHEAFARLLAKVDATLADAQHELEDMQDDERIYNGVTPDLLLMEQLDDALIHVIGAVYGIRKVIIP